MAAPQVPNVVAAFSLKAYQSTRVSSFPQLLIHMKKHANGQAPKPREGKAKEW